MYTTRLLYVGDTQQSIFHRPEEQREICVPHERFQDLRFLAAILVELNDNGITDVAKFINMDKLSEINLSEDFMEEFSHHFKK